VNPSKVHWGLGAALLAASLCGSTGPLYAQVEAQQAYLKAFPGGGSRIEPRASFPALP